MTLAYVVATALIASAILVIAASYVSQALKELIQTGDITGTGRAAWAARL